MQEQGRELCRRLGENVPAKAVVSVKAPRMDACGGTCRHKRVSMAWLGSWGSERGRQLAGTLGTILYVLCARGVRHAGRCS